MTQIIVGVNDSERAADAVALAVTLARTTGAELLIAHAYPCETIAEPRLAARPRALRPRARGEGAGAPSRRGRRRAGAHRPAPGRLAGAPAPGPRRARERRGDRDRLEPPRRPRPCARRDHRGATAPRGAVSGARRATRLHGGELRRILVGHDGGDESQGALEVALAAHGDVHLVRVLEPTSVEVQASMAGAWIPPTDLETECREAFEAKFSRLGDAVEREFVVGDAVAELVRRTLDADLVIVGSRGYGPLRSVLLGSVCAARPPGLVSGDGRPARRGRRGHRPARRHHRDRPAGVTAPMRVLVAGGGVAGMEAILALRDARRRARGHHAAGARAHLRLPADGRRRAVRARPRPAPAARRVRPRDEHAARARRARRRRAGRSPARRAGAALPFDALLVAVGAWSEPAVPGATTWTPELDQEVMGGLLADLEEGYAKRVAFVVPEGAGWPLPAYELALMTAWDARDMGQDDVEVTVHTPEPAPLAMFGEQASESLRRDLDEAGVIGAAPAAGADDDLSGRRVVALPRAAARPIAGLPRDERGFVPVDAPRARARLRGVWAAGDCTAFPIKQGGLAAQQADAAAESIAARRARTSSRSRSGRSCAASC